MDQIISVGGAAGAVATPRVAPGRPSDDNMAPRLFPVAVACAFCDGSPRPDCLGCASARAQAISGMS